MLGTNSRLTLLVTAWPGWAVLGLIKVQNMQSYVELL